MGASSGYRPRYFSRSWAMYKGEKGWVKVTLLMALATFVPIAGPLGVSGYLYEWARLTAWGSDAAPKRSGIKVGECIASGWRVFVATLPWNLVYGILVFGIYALAGLTGNDILMSIVRLLVSVASLFYAVVTMVAGLRAAIYSKIGAGINPSRVFELIGRDAGELFKLVVPLLVVSIVLALVTGVVFGIVLALNFNNFKEVIYYLYTPSYAQTGAALGAFQEALKGIALTFLPTIIVMSFLDLLVSLPISGSVINAVALWIRQFNVPAWGGPDDPLPPTQPALGAPGMGQQPYGQYQQAGYGTARPGAYQQGGYATPMQQPMPQPTYGAPAQQPGFQQPVAPQAAQPAAQTPGFQPAQQPTYPAAVPQQGTSYGAGPAQAGYAPQSTAQYPTAAPQQQPMTPYPAAQPQVTGQTGAPQATPAQQQATASYPEPQYATQQPAQFTGVQAPGQTAAPQAPELQYAAPQEQSVAQQAMPFQGYQQPAYPAQQQVAAQPQQPGPASVPHDAGSAETTLLSPLTPAQPTAAPQLSVPSEPQQPDAMASEQGADAPAATNPAESSHTGPSATEAATVEPVPAEPAEGEPKPRE